MPHMVVLKAYSSEIQKYDLIVRNVILCAILVKVSYNAIYRAGLNESLLWETTVEMISQTVSHPFYTISD